MKAASSGMTVCAAATTAGSLVKTAGMTERPSESASVRIPLRPSAICRMRSSTARAVARRPCTPGDAIITYCCLMPAACTSMPRMHLHACKDTAKLLMVQPAAR